MPKPTPSKSPRVCVLTPAGRGAIAVVAVEGEGAVAAVDRFFQAVSGKSLGQVPVGRIAFGRWGSEQGEEVVVTRAEQSVEVHCHGGVAASRAIVASLAGEGCTTVDSHEWLSTQSGDSIEAAAHQMLGKAVTQKAALVLLDQFNGALKTALNGILAHLDAGAADQALASVQALLERRELGERLTTAVKVVLTGPPNVGKSSLINALVGYERAIVFDLPGTTRDAVSAITAIDGWATELVDTAGLRTSATGIEQAGIELAQSVLADADVVLRVGEAPTLLASGVQATEFDAWTTGKRVIDVANKADQLTSAEHAQLSQRTGENLMLTSATTGAGVDALLVAISALVSPTEVAPGTAVPFTSDQVQTLVEVADSLANGDASSAKQALLAVRS